MTAGWLLRDTPRRLDIVAGALILAALLAALYTTRGLKAPHDPDNFRDISQAQTARDGHPLSDQYYRGEWAWYNPLLAWTLASIAGVSGVSVEEAHVYAGPWLNLLGPITFYLLAIRLVGRPAALAALTVFLFFVSGDEPSWAVATYSPWLFTGNFGLGVFFSAALALVWTADGPSAARACVAGALMGLTFLAHTAPALILVGVACVLLATRPRTLLTAGATALMVASPFLYGIAAHYHFRIVNTAPLAWRYQPITRTGLRETLQHNVLLIGAALTGLTLAPSRFSAAWLLTTIALLAYTVAPLPRLLPAFHFWLYATAVFALLSGATVAWLLPRPHTLPALAIFAVAFHWPAYINRGDLANGRQGALLRNDAHLAASQFLRSITAPDDVVLGSSGSVNLIIGPAGRKTVASDLYFSNPYVAFAERNADRDKMLAALDTGDRQAFTALAHQYGVKAVALVGGGHCTSATDLLPLLGRFGDVCVLGVRQ